MWAAQHGRSPVLASQSPPFQRTSGISARILDGNRTAQTEDMPNLESTVSKGLWEKLQTRAKAAQEPISHIVSRALADYFETPHHTVYQISTATALVGGVYEGAVRIAKLREHGDLGLGTFEDAVITRFASDAAVTLDQCQDIRQLTACFDSLRRSENEFYVLRVTGSFAHVRTRAVCRTEEGVPLVQAAAVQPEFDFHDISGTLVGFWTPEYARSLNVPGYHLHFLSDDLNSGGHLLQCNGAKMHLEIQREGNYHVALPETDRQMHNPEVSAHEILRQPK
jgi:acetolactate decarboxylase